MAHVFRKHQAGFTLIELVIVIVVAGVLTAYAAMKTSSSGVYSLYSQSQTMASDLRHAQALAITLGRSLRVSIAPGVNGSYSVGCAASTASPCNAILAAPMTNPATGRPFTVTLEKEVVLSGSVATLDINSMGKPATGAVFTLDADGTQKNVTIAAVTGFVDVP